ncbi:MAG: alcohol dehydrogenase catalytic domain-containing protein [Anaerolineae bacterium]|nr:alcohol dehydrogenase catalytic domain-containing protein [Anaerolineae bacterium]
MRALVWDGDLRLDTHIAVPELSSDQALLKIRRAGICNTDLELVRGMYQFSGILGHEFVAEVVAGPAALVGKRVVGEINVACGQCDFCQAGIPSQCRDRATVGIRDHPGAFADYLALAVRNLHVVPNSVVDEAAVFTEPLAAALQVLETIHVSPHDQVVVLGLGKLGMLVAQVLKLTGASVVGVVRHQKQADLLAKWLIPAVELAAVEPEQASVVVDCSGTGQGFADAMRLVRSRGTIVLKSTYQQAFPVDLTQVAVREIRVMGSRCGPFAAALRLLEQGLVDVEALIEARYSLDQAREAFDKAGQPGALKVLLET